MVLPTDEPYWHERQVQILSKSREKKGQNWIFNIFDHNSGSGKKDSFHWEFCLSQRKRKFAYSKTSRSGQMNLSSCVVFHFFIFYAKIKFSMAIYVKAFFLNRKSPILRISLSWFLCLDLVGICEKSLSRMWATQRSWNLCSHSMKQLETIRLHSGYGFWQTWL